MDEMPCTQEEWSVLYEACSAHANAVLMEDDVLAASLLPEVMRIIQNLKARHGDHPVLLETEADYEDDPDRRVTLYHRALTMAREHGLPTYTIQLSLASVLLDQFKLSEAKAALMACERDVIDSGDRMDRDWWLSAWEDLQTKLI